MCIPAAHASPAQNREINEALLAAVWNEQAPLRGPMWDCEGNPVAVVYRGRWSAGSGPDFEGAMLALGEGNSRLVTGSVEIHLRCSDWWAHGHHTDPRYESVVLHVVLWPNSARPVTRADGVSVPTLVLADYITMSPAELLEKVTPLVANLGALSEEPCWQRTQHRPLSELTALIDQAGDARLLSKAALMEADLEVYGSADEVFYLGIMDALGYSSNRAQMKSLALALPLNQLLCLPLTANEQERAALLESVLLAAAGFLPSRRSDLGEIDWLSASYSEEAEELWRVHAPLLGLAVDTPPVISGWNVERVRPANSPPRRLAAAARLLVRLLWSRGGMLGPFIQATETEGGAGSGAGSPKQLARAWTQLLTVPAEGYWGAHSDFGSRLGNDSDQQGVALVGESRAAELVVNIVLPLLIAYADRHNKPELRESALSVYAVYPRLAENSITRSMGDEALGPRRKEGITGARRQQGLIHLYRLYCQARRCYDCPVSGVGAPRAGN